VEQTQERRGWRWGVNRWIILGIIILGVILAGAYPPIRPHIQLPAEKISETPLVVLPVLGELHLTNTLIATLLADVILLIITFVFVRRAVRSGSLVPTGLAGAVEAFLEVLYNLTETTAGKWAKTIFPYFAAITMMVLVVNWMELIPGVDTIGVFDSHHIPHPEDCTFNEFLGGSVVAVGGDHECASGVIPFVRVASTDLNFTVGLAIISLVMTQVIGVRALGLSYFTKFVNVKTIFTKPFFGFIDFLVGIFEIVSEFSKIISFSFRLFGNIFAGSVLLFVIGALIPVFAQTAVLILEFGVGLIQAIVFGMLTMVFMSQATHAHGDDHH
jgi:F-type H+-transporting ATPase subunit a